MSVIAAKRKPSQFEVFNHATKLRKEITNLLLRDFGYKHKEYPYESENQKQKRLAFEMWYISKERDAIMESLRTITREITLANKIYPTMETELVERRLHQDRAIAECANLLSELQYCIETLPVNVEKYFHFDDLVQTEINLLKAWRKADNKLKEKVCK